MRKVFLLTFITLLGLTYSKAAIGDKYEAEAFIASEGAQAEENASLSGGGNVGYIQNETWIAFTDISFDGTEEWIDVAAAGSTGGNIEFRLDAVDGTLLGTAVVSGSSGWSDYITFKADISATTGSHILYLVFTGGDGYLFNVDYFKLNADVPSYTLTTSASPAEGGIVTTDLEGPDYTQGTSVELTATNNVGYVFDHWEDNNGTSLSTDNPMTVKVMQDTSIVAGFVSVPTSVLDTTITNGYITLSPEPDVDGSDAVYNTGTEVTMTASAVYGYEFSHWENGSGENVSSENTVTFTINNDTSLTAIITEVLEYSLPEWSFDNAYSTIDTGSYTYYQPSGMPISGDESFAADAWVLPNNPTFGAIGLTANTSNLSYNDVRDNKVCRITWSGANEVSDLTDASQHNQYYQFQFPTTGYEAVGIDFTFSGGQSSVADYLGLAYSIDGGTTWIDGGEFHAEDHWNSWPNYTTALEGADDKDTVIVRLIGVTASTGGSNNFNLDHFNVTGFASLKDNTVAYYKFDVETADTVLDEMETYNGMVVDKMLAVDGFDSLALSFDNDTNYVMVRDSEALNMQDNSFSISAIVQFDVSANSSFEKNILMKGGTGNDTIKAVGLDEEWVTSGKWYSFSMKGGELRFYVDDSTTKTQLAVNVMDYFPADEWVHVAAVRDRGEDSLKLFINGYKVASILDETENSVNTEGIPLIIGNNHMMNNAYNGGLDELTILDRALTEEEVYGLAGKYNLNKQLLKWNVNVTSISVNGEDVSPFLPSIIKEYEVNLEEGTTDIEVIAVPEDADATVEYTTNADSSIVVITAQDGETTDQFILHFNYVSSEATLSDLTISDGTLSPAFSSDVTAYSVELPAATTLLTVTATPTSDLATVAGDGDITLVEGQTDTIKVTVTAQDETTEITYTINVTESTSSAIDNNIAANMKAYFDNNSLVISSDSEIKQIDLFDLSGRSVITKEHLGKMSIIDANHLNNSMYILIVQTYDNQITTIKLVK